MARKKVNNSLPSFDELITQPRPHLQRLPDRNAFATHVIFIYI